MTRLLPIATIEGNTMEVSEFLRLYPLRSPSLMWLLGAGCSSAAGIPTASDMIWDFKRLLYCSELRKPVQCLPQKGDPSFRQILELHFATKPGFPPAGSAEEYSFYFEHTYPNEKERSKYIQQMIANGRPSLGHRAIAALVSMGSISRIWTTNFDRLLEDSVFFATGTSRDISVITLDNAHLIDDAVKERDRKLILKLHGDFQSRRMKNTAAELIRQDELLRNAFKQECSLNGLVVAGYSGRDDSIMQVFESMVEDRGRQAFPSGFFWVHRSASAPAPRVTALVNKMQAEGIDAHFLHCETFDELLTDILAMYPDAPRDITNASSTARRLKSVSIPRPGQGWPVIRMNACPILEYPSLCRLVKCDLTGTKAIRDAIKAQGARAIAMPRRDRIICFGSDAEIQKAFHMFHIRQFDVYPLERTRLEFESAEIGLLNQAICHALSNTRGLQISRSHGDWVLSICEQSPTHTLQALGQQVGSLVGVVPGTSRNWREAIRIKLQYRLGKLFLVFEPTESIDSDEMPPGSIARGTVRRRFGDDEEKVKGFIRERAARRYNKNLNLYLNGWAEVFADPGSSVGTIASFDCVDGIDARFKIFKTTAFSRRITS